MPAICHWTVSLFDLVADPRRRLSGAHWAAWGAAVSPGDGGPREPPFRGGRLQVAGLARGIPDGGRCLAPQRRRSGTAGRTRAPPSASAKRVAISLCSAPTATQGADAGGACAEVSARGGGRGVVSERHARPRPPGVCACAPRRRVGGPRRAVPIPQRTLRQQALTWPPSEPPSCGSETNAWLGAALTPRPPRVRWAPGLGASLGCRNLRLPLTAASAAGRRGPQ